MSQEDDFQQFITSLDERFTPSEEVTVNAIDRIRTGVKDYVETRNLQTLVIGLNGSLSSTIVAALCQEQYTGVPLIGIVMPTGATTPFSLWAAENYCTDWHELVLPDRVIEDASELSVDIAHVFKQYMDIDVKHVEYNGSEWQWTISHTVLTSLAHKINGVVLGSKTWSDMFATFYITPGEALYFPIQAVNAGYELPEFAKQLAVWDNIIDVQVYPSYIDATYKEVDVVINGNLGNLDDNLSTQLKRFRTLDKVQRILLKFELGRAASHNESLTRFMTGLPTKYTY